MTFKGQPIENHLILTGETFYLGELGNISAGQRLTMRQNLVHKVPNTAQKVFISPRGALNF